MSFRAAARLLSLLPLGLLCACSHETGPWPMPTGYTYHHGEYKAPPGPEPVFRTWDASGGQAPGGMGSSSVSVYDMDTGKPKNPAGAVPPAPSTDLPRLPPRGAPSGPQPGSPYLTSPTTGETQGGMTDMNAPAAAPQETPQGTMDHPVLPPPRHAVMPAPAHVYAPLPPAPVSAPAAMLSDPQWRKAADDLVTRLVAGFGRPAEGVWLAPDEGTPPDASSPFMQALNAALPAQKINVVPALGQSPFTLRYGASAINAASGQMMLTITLMSGQTRVAAESGLYTVSGAAP